MTSCRDFSFREKEADFPEASVGELVGTFGTRLPRITKESILTEGVAFRASLRHLPRLCRPKLVQGR